MSGITLPPDKGRLKRSMSRIACKELFFYAITAFSLFLSYFTTIIAYEEKRFVMRVKSAIVSVALVVVMLFVSATQVFADTRGTYYLPANQVWVYAGNEYHDVNQLRVGAWCHAVYPYSGADTYVRIQCKVQNSSGEIVTRSNRYTLYDTAEEATCFFLKNGYLGTTYPYFYIRGNSSDDAYTDFTFMGTYYY